MLRKLIVFCLLIINLWICFKQMDKSFKKYAFGENVEDFIEKLNNSKLFDDDNRFDRIIKRIAFIESRFAQNEITFEDCNYGKSIIALSMKLTIIVFVFTIFVNFGTKKGEGSDQTFGTQGLIAMFVLKANVP